MTTISGLRPDRLWAVHTGAASISLDAARIAPFHAIPTPFLHPSERTCILSPVAT